MARRNNGAVPSDMRPRRGNAGWFVLCASGILMILMMPQIAKLADTVYDVFLADAYGEADFVALIVFLLLMGFGFFATAMFLSFLGRLIVHKVSGWIA